MHVLLIALQQEAPETNDGRGTEPPPLARLEAEQALAMTSALHAGGVVPPLLVCVEGSWLHAEATARELPVLAVSGAGSMAAHVRLWRWQRPRDFLLIQTVGEASARLGRRVLAMRKKGSAALSHAFFVRPPAPELCRGRALRAASRVFCGSDHVRGRIRELWEALPEKRRSAATLEVLPPGIHLADYLPQPEPWPGASGGERRCIFGMGESLAADSGALAMVRAMAALWQREDLPPWEVRMFGAGPRFEEILHEAVSLGVAGRLCILGDQPSAEAARQCAAWVAPGTSPQELPQTLWAGVAAGLPLICAQSGLHRERLAGMPPMTAVRIPERDPQALAGALIAIMRDERLRARMRQAGESVRPRIGLAAMAAHFCAFCADVALQEAEGASGAEA
ncbi:glycosyltransferase [Desulfovibrio sp.]|uniref:glycosyltransferase n=1 Tax=Desulfovibrio sp. TaxID=885 RepID=UPI0023D5A186|nr:glycosyltransferase [Desulfovibrio sp.]MDE7241787.1 glycosyltransferase [Desulfovibrio sp.]